MPTYVQELIDYFAVNGSLTDAINVTLLWAAREADQLRALYNVVMGG